MVTKVWNAAKKVLKNDNGYVSIETVVVAALVVMLGWGIIESLQTSAGDVAADAINKLRTEVGLAALPEV